MDEPAEDPSARVKWVYSSQSSDEVKGRYDAWAESYDHDLTTTYDYVLPAITAQDFVRWVEPGASILDAGAGTGLVGVELHRLGYTDLTAMDISRRSATLRGSSMNWSRPLKRSAVPAVGWVNLTFRLRP